MKALSVRQPWSELIALGRKSVELRTWHVHYRGPLLIVTGVARPRVNPEVFGLPRELPRGVAVCLVDLVSVEPATVDDAARACCDISPGEYAWTLANPRRVDPIPVRGRLNLFEFDWPPASAVAQ